VELSEKVAPQHTAVIVVDMQNDFCTEGGAMDTIGLGTGLDEIAPQAGEMIVQKHRYSAFIDTPLQQLLRNRGIKTILVTGVGTNGCVECTARDGFMLDFFTITVSDCCMTYWPEQHVGSLRDLETLFGEVLPADEIVACWKPVAAVA